LSLEVELEEERRIGCLGLPSSGVKYPSSPMLTWLSTIQGKGREELRGMGRK
jgi:hypothetical protein